jgi:hypothetical protein
MTSSPSAPQPLFRTSETPRRSRMGSPSPLSNSQTLELEDEEGGNLPISSSPSGEIEVPSLSWFQEFRFSIASDIRLQIYIILLAYSLLFIIYGLLVPIIWPVQRDIENEIGGFWKGIRNIVLSRSTLITDSVLTAGIRPALVHSGVLGVLTCSLVYSTGR